MDNSVKDLFQQRSQARIVRFDEQPVPRATLDDLQPNLWGRFETSRSRDDRDDSLAKRAMARIDDRARGGDVDLLIETDAPLPLLQRARIKMELEALLGLPVDIVVQARNKAPSPFQRLVRAQARRLEIQA